MYIRSPRAKEFFGKTFLDHLNETIIEIGPITYSRQEMVELLDCGNFNAAARINKTLKKLKVDTFQKLLKMDPYSLLRMKGVGETQIYVLMCIIDFNKHDVWSWWKFDVEQATVTFPTHQKNAKKRAKKRQHE